MTRRDFMRLHHPSAVSSLYDGGVCGCPEDHPDLCKADPAAQRAADAAGCKIPGVPVDCGKCWDAEIPDTSTTNNPVEHPNYYCKGGIECIDVIRAVLGDKFKYYCQGNVIKYIFRCYDKNGVEDIKKARKYIDWMIEEEQK